MKYILATFALAVASFHSHAVAGEVLDTVYFYQSWEQMMYFQPVAMLINPYIEAYTPFEVHIYSDDQQVNRHLAETGFIAVSLGDSIWLANSEYIKDNFNGDVGQFDGLVPLFYDEKTAFLTNPGKLSVKNILFGETDEDDYNVDYFYIDFQKRKVKRVTHKYLSQLLEDYHDLQMRYEGRKDYKKHEIIEDYFFKYIDRVSQDVLKPYLLDIVEDM